MKKMLDASPYGQESEVFINCDLWHFRSLMFTRQPDFMIGNSYGKFIQRDTLAKGKAFEVPLIRLGFRCSTAIICTARPPGAMKAQ